MLTRSLRRRLLRYGKGSLLESRVDYILEEGAGSDVLFVSLTSFGSSLDIPPEAGVFEWHWFFHSYPCHRLYLMDCFRHWYLGPVLGFSHSLDQTAARILETQKRLRARRLILFGSSMGGFGAMLLGAKTGADLAIAIAPQTNVDASFLDSIGDRRWPQKTAELNAVGYAHRDLCEVYEASGGPARTHVLYDGACPDDGLHATRLASFPNVQVEDVGYGEHICAYALAKSGRLTQIAEAALAPPAVPKNRWWGRGFGFRGARRE